MRALLLALVLCLLGTSSSWASAPPGSLPSTVCNQCGAPTAAGGDGTITVQHGVSDAVPGRGSPTQGRREAGRDYSYINEFATPTCQGNGLHHHEALCASALASCRVARQIRFWIWHQRVDVAAGPPEVMTRGPWRQENGTFCLGPDDPGVPNIVKTIAAARTAFEQRIEKIAPPTIRTVPGPRTLVHYRTQLTAQGAQPFTDSVTVAGATVHLVIQPESFRWVLGDGTTKRTAGPTTTHTYSVRARRVIRVDVSWGGYFTVNNETERYPIDPPATSTGRPGVVTVVEARAENLA